MNSYPEREIARWVFSKKHSGSQKQEAKGGEFRGFVDLKI